MNGVGHQMIWDRSKFQMLFLRVGSGIILVWPFWCEGELPTEPIRGSVPTRLVSRLSNLRSAISFGGRASKATTVSCLVGAKVGDHPRCR